MQLFGFKDEGRHFSHDWLCLIPRDWSASSSTLYKRKGVFQCLDWVQKDGNFHHSTDLHLHTSIAKEHNSTEGRNIEEMDLPGKEAPVLLEFVHSNAKQVVDCCFLLRLLHMICIESFDHQAVLEESPD